MRALHDSVMMDLAAGYATLSNCSRLNVGCVIAKGYSVLATGFNESIPQCHHEDDSPCLNAFHAEVNAIGTAAKDGAALAGSTLYVTHSPCRSCAQLIAVSGITRVVYKHEYRLLDGVELLRAEGLVVDQDGDVHLQ